MSQDLTELRERAARLRAEAEASWVAKQAAEGADLLDAFQQIAARQLAVFQSLPCGGEVAKLPACSESNAATCAQRGEPSCPRSIVAFDAAQARQADIERLRESGVPSKVRRAVLVDFYPTASTQVVDEWLPGGKLLLLLAGAAGLGKSAAAGYAILRSPGRWLNATEMATVAGFKHEERLVAYRSARLLVIDDLGREFSEQSGWARTAVTNLIIDRYEDELRTVITSNLDAKAWKAYADPRLVDRLAGSGQVFGAAGESLRRRA